MRTIISLLAIGALVGGCKRTENGDVIVKRPSHVSVQTTEDTLHMPKITTRTDTVNAPVIGANTETVAVKRPYIGTRTETVVVKRPVIGSQKAVVKVPSVQHP